MSINPPQVVCIGAATLDAIVSVPQPLPVDGRLLATTGALAGGGPAATAAVTLARQAVSTAFIGLVGDDDAGETIRRGLEAEGIDVAGLRTAPGATSAFSAVLVDPTTAGRLIVTHPGTWPPAELSPTDVETCRNARWVHVDQTGWSHVVQLRKVGVQTLVSVDGGNPIPDLDLSLVDLYAPAESGLLAASGKRDLDAAMAWSLDAGARLVVVTRGSEGCVAMARFDLEQAGGQTLLKTQPRGPVSSISEPAHDSTIVSTLGAGDVFHGALLASLVSGQSVRAALRFASRVAGLSCAGLDGRSAIPRASRLAAQTV